MEDQPVIVCPAFVGLPGCVRTCWGIALVSCLRDDFRTGKASLACMACVSDPLFLCFFAAEGERSWCCSCGRIRLAMCVSAVGDMGDFGDATFSSAGSWKSFHVSRLGSGGSSLVKLMPPDSDFLG